MYNRLEYIVVLFTIAVVVTIAVTIAVTVRFPINVSFVEPCSDVIVRLLGFGRSFGFTNSQSNIRKLYLAFGPSLFQTLLLLIKCIYSHL